jgi:hypothetical protein
MDTSVRWTPGESWPFTHRWSQCLHDARNSYAQYFPNGYRLLGRYLDKAYNSGPGGVGSNPPHGISVYARFNSNKKRLHRSPPFISAFRRLSKSLSSRVYSRKDLPAWLSAIMELMELSRMLGKSVIFLSASTGLVKDRGARPLAFASTHKFYVGPPN